MSPEFIEVHPGHPSLDEVLEVVQVLRHHVSIEELRRRFEQGVSEGYRLLGVRDSATWKAAAGFHVFTNFNNGKILYVDDLVTIDDSRSRGYGKALNGHLVELAKAEGCATIELDSGVQRHDAHRFYLRERYDISSHHFSRRL